MARTSHLPLGSPSLAAQVALAITLIVSGCSNPDSSQDPQDVHHAAGQQQVARTAPGAGAWSDVPAGDTPYNLLLISLDTTRRDHLSCYGFAKPTTPNIDRIAAEGVLFEAACTPVPVTLPSHTTMLTGLYPFQHGVRNNGSYVLADSVTTLPEMLKERGYATCAVIAAFTLEHRFGLDQGFDTYDDRFSLNAGEDDGGMAQRAGTEVTRRALAWVDEHQQRPFFLLAHYFEPHAPYRPPEPYAGRFPGDPYSGEIACMDAAVGDLLDGLRSRGLFERTVIVIVADHGEGLREHDEPTHSMFIYRTTQDVPFLLRLPPDGRWSGDAWRNRKVSGLVSLTDILPTVWNALGLESDALPTVAGLSLLPLVENGGRGHAWLYHETLVPDLDYGMSDLRGLQDERWKYIRAPRPELYDLDEDPHELENLADEQTERRERMEAQLAAILSTAEPTAAPLAMDAEAIEKLRSLGYVHGSRPDRVVKADPKDQSGVARQIARAQTLAGAGQLPQAVAVLDSVLVDHPRAHMALRERAGYLLRLGRNEEALAAFAAAVDDCRGRADEVLLRAEQARAYFQIGRTDEALASGRQTELAILVSGQSLASTRLVIGVTTLDAVRAAAGSRPPVDVVVTTVGDTQWVPVKDRMLPLVVMYAVVIAGLFLPASSLVEEREKRTLDALLITPLRMSEVLAGKGALGVVLAVLMGWVTLALNDAFGVQPLAMTLFLLLGGVMMAEVGLVVGSWAKDSNTLFTTVKGGALLVVAPVLFTLFPGLPQWVAQLFPTYYFLQPIYDMAVTGTTMSDHLLDLAVCVALCLALLPAVRAMGRRLEQQTAAAG